MVSNISEPLPSEFVRVPTSRIIFLFESLQALAAKILPIALSCALFGQLIFLAAKYYWGIEHIGRAIWICILLCLPLVVWQRKPWRSIQRADVFFLGLVGLIIVSFLIQGLSQTRGFFYNIGFFCLIPYLAGRLLDEKDAKRLLKLALGLAAVSVLLALFAFFNLPHDLFYADRPILYPIYDERLRVWQWDSAFLSISGGCGVLLLISFLLKPVGKSFKHYNKLKSISVAIMACIALWLLIRVGLRSALVSIFAVSLATLIIAKWNSTRRRLKILMWLVIASAIGLYLQPPARMDLFKQIQPDQVLSTATVKTTDEKSWPDYAKINEACFVSGNSAAVRMQYLEKSTVLFLHSPLFGIGAGNFGHAACALKSDYASPHSLVLHIAVETGIFGLLLYLGFVWSSLRLAVSAFVHPDFPKKNLLWMAGTLWIYFLMWEQLSGNYFSDFHYFAISGLMVGFLSRYAGLIQNKAEKAA